MTSHRILVTAALLALTASTASFARPFNGPVRQVHLSLGIDRNFGHSWCLRDYSNDEIDCSYATRAQCFVTAAGRRDGFWFDPSVNPAQRSERDVDNWRRTQLKIADRRAACGALS